MKKKDTERPAALAVTGRRPMPPGLSVKREKLVSELLEEETPIVVLRGGAGWGKTELARQYCAEAEISWAGVVLGEDSIGGKERDFRDGKKRRRDEAGGFRKGVFWISLKEKNGGNPDPLAVLGDLRSRLEAGSGASSEADPGTSSEAGSGTSMEVGSGVSPEAGARAESPEDGSGARIIVCDDYSRNAPIDGALSSLAERVEGGAEGTRLIIITREGPPEFLSGYAARGSCRIIEEEELAFSEEEQAALLQKMKNGQSEGFRRAFFQCVEMLEGWPAGMALAVRYLEKKKIHTEVTDWPYFMQQALIDGLLNWEVFESQPPEVKGFLLQTGVLDCVEEAFCEKALGIDETRGILKALIGKNLLFHRPEDGPGVYFYRRVFRIFLEGRLGRENREGVIRKAARYYLETGDVSRAASYGTRIGDTPLLVKLILTHGEGFLREDKGGILEHCMDYLEKPEGVLSRYGAGCGNIDPRLLGIAAQFHYKRGEQEKAEAFLNQADSSFGKENPYSVYRSLYRCLLHYREDPVKYKEQLNSALFVLEEQHFPLPYLREAETELLNEILGKEKDEKGEGRKLEISLFGDFQARVSGEERPLAWRTKKSRELLAFLVEMNGTAVGRRQLLEKLWNDEMPEHAVSMLHNMFYNIRKELAPFQMADVISYKDRMYSIDMSRIETDQKSIQRLCQLVDQEDAEELEKNEDSFLSYWGRYLGDMDCQWCIEIGEYYDARFFKGCVMFAERKMEQEDYEKAILFLKNALLVNPYSEGVFGKLLRCYGATRNYKQLKSEYQRFRELLKKDLGMEPGEEAEQAYQAALPDKGKTS